MTVAGFDVLGKTKGVLANIPGVEKFVEDNQGKTPSPAKSDEAKKLERQINENEKLGKTIKEQNAMIVAFEKDLSNSEKEIQTLQQEIKSLESQLEAYETSTEEEKGKDIGKLYKEMSSKKAAEIIPNLKEDDALFILSSLDEKQVSDILTKMTIEDAVKFTNLIAADNE